MADGIREALGGIVESVANYQAGPDWGGEAVGYKRLHGFAKVPIDRDSGEDADRDDVLFDGVVGVWELYTRNICCSSLLGPFPKWNAP